MYSWRILTVIIPASILANWDITELQAFELTLAGRPVSRYDNVPAHRPTTGPRNHIYNGGIHLLQVQWNTVYRDATVGHRIGPIGQLGRDGTLFNIYPFANGFRISTGLAYRQESTSRFQREADTLQSGSVTLFQPHFTEPSVDNLDLYFGIGFDVQILSSGRSVTFDFGVTNQLCDYCDNENWKTSGTTAAKEYTNTPVQRINGWRRHFQPVLRFKLRYKF